MTEAVQRTTACGSARGIWGPVPNMLDTADASASRRHATGKLLSSRKGNSWPVFLFLTALVVPWAIQIGPLRLSLCRFVLLAMLLPCLVIWITGRAGRMRVADVALLLFSLWSALGLVVIHGFGIAAEPAGIGFIEAVGAYLLGRCYIRDADDFHNAVQLLFRIVLFLMPFAAVELVSGQTVLRDAFGAILPTAAWPSQYRSGLTRVQSVFDHAILFGVFTGSILGLAHLVLGYQKGLARRSWKSGIVAATALMSLSAGPVGAMTMQVLLLTWNGLLRGLGSRWKLLGCLLFSLIVTIEIVARRSALNVITSFFVFDSGSYWYRRLIWDYGFATAVNHPLFGMGLNDWERPAWMPSASIDNFWLFHTVRSGFPAVFLLMAAFFSIVLAVGFRKGLDDRLVEYRTGFLIAMTFFFLVGWTVHFLGPAYVLFLFLLGSGIWMLDAQATEGSASRAKVRPGRLSEASGAPVDSTCMERQARRQTRALPRRRLNRGVVP